MEMPMVAPALIQGDLESVLTGMTQTAYDPKIRSAFVFRGLAVGDLAVTGLAYERAVKSR